MRQLLVAASLATVMTAAAPVRAAPCVPSAGDLHVPAGLTCQLSGVHRFGSVRVDAGGVIEVNPYAGGDLEATGNLELRANTITVAGTITARGRGYQTLLCGDGGAPDDAAGAAGAGGCAVRDSGGGGAHFGRGGRGTKDCAASGCTFPLHWEEDCGNTRIVDGGGAVSCSSQNDCRSGDGLPPTNGESFFHSIYEPEFGAAGGDKGCRDGDGRTLMTAGGGGGRIVLVANDSGASTITIDGTLDATGRRGCGNGNDSAGGGAGGTVLVVGSQVTIGATATISAAGGLGGDTRGTGTSGECPASGGFQQGGTCDDCGGGGGGGIVSVLSVQSVIDDRAVFDVSGALGGVCEICRGEAGGGAGELQISGAYVGEFCDGFDNDFDDAVDEDLPPLECAGGNLPSCVGGVPQICPADVPACVGDVTDTRARFLVVVDSSGSMLNDLTGAPTFGDGSIDHPGIDRDGNGAVDDSRLVRAKGALSTVIAAYPEIDFALARYHQDQQVDQSCQLAHTFECRQLCCSYDDPRDNTGPAPTPACTLDGGAAGPLTVLKSSPSEDECINYGGTCGPPRRGADVLVGFGADINQHLMWLDGAETNFIDDETVGDYCDFAAGGDCELRGAGPTPLANALTSADDFLSPIVECDAAARRDGVGCRRYGVILLTDGAESCNGNPVTAAGSLFADLDVETFVIGFSVLPGERAGLDAIARAGSGGVRDAFLVGDEDGLANALATIVGESIVTEVCNSRDDDCDGRIDEGFAIGLACDDGELGTCRDTGETVCNATGDGVTCDVEDGAPPGTEICNGIDDNCNGRIDEGLDCGVVCTPTGRDVCNGLDDNCNGAVDEDDPDVGQPCGATDDGVCQRGELRCIAGREVCVGEIGPDPGGERCNGVDDDCDGTADDSVMCPGTTGCVEGACRLPCGNEEFSCPVGFECVDASGGRFCVPTACLTCRPGEICRDNQCIDPCAGVTCDPGETCRFGDCVDCYVTGCPDGEVCAGGQCVVDRCEGVDCGSCGGLGCSCIDGACIPNCRDSDCPDGQRCGAAGTCVADPCGDISCSLGRVCIDGACVVDPCDGRTCPRGQDCFEGACVADGCELAECSAGTTCEIVSSDGDVRCVPAPGVSRELIYTGGAGGCRSGRDTGIAMLLAMLALVLSLAGRGRRVS